LGIDGIYFNPLFVSPSNHKYDIQDYAYIDPHIGTIINDGGALINPEDDPNYRNPDMSNASSVNQNAEMYIKRTTDPENLQASNDKLKELIDEAGKRGIKILLDGVFNHSGSFNKWVEFGVEGWRIDVAADLGHSTAYNHEFYREMRKRVKEVNPEAVILAEVYGDSSAWLRGDELKNNSKNFEHDIREKMAKMPWNSMEIAMNQLDNHDHSRFLSRTSGFVDEQKSATDTSKPELADKDLNKGILKEAVVMQMTMPGAPTLYYGNEAGLAGFTDPDSRRTYPWGNEDQELLAFYKEIISIRKEYSSLRDGSLLSLKYDQEGIYSYGRWNSENKVIVAFNNNEKEQVLSIPLWSMNISDNEKLNLIFTSDRDSHSSTDEQIAVNNGNLVVTVPAFGSIIAVSDKGSLAGDISKLTAELRPEIKKITSSSKEGEPLLTIEFSQEMHQRDISDAFKITPSLKGTFAWNGTKVGFFPTEIISSGKYTIEISNYMRSTRGNLFLREGQKTEITVK
jgi:glycosidase